MPLQGRRGRRPGPSAGLMNRGIDRGRTQCREGKLPSCAMLIEQLMA